ncbi:MAG: sugar transferase [Chloroflexales bacterium]|nr:sugar transferase [Chloroflexales bacterium]
MNLHAKNAVGSEWPALAHARALGRRWQWLLHLALLAADLLLIVPAFWLAHWMRYELVWPQPLKRFVAEVSAAYNVPFGAYWQVTLGMVVVLAVLFEMKGLYRLPRSAGLLDHLGIILSATTTGVAIVIVWVFLARPPSNSRLIFAFAGLSIVAVLGLWRALLLSGRRWLWASGIGLERVLVVGGTGLGQHVMASVAAQPHHGHTLVGYVDDGSEARATQPPAPTSGRFRHLGTSDDLAAVVRHYCVDTVILALPFWAHGQLPLLAQRCRELGVEFQIAPDLYQLSFDRVDVQPGSGVPLIALRELSLKGWNLALKRTLDTLLVLLSLPLTLPLGLLLALLIRRDSPGGPLIVQSRVGKNGRLFRCFKFRTMVADAEARKAALVALNEADGPLFKIKNDPRITRVGRWLRRTSMDELPQLLNVLLGEMSLVGPRPALPSEVAAYEQWHQRRLEVLPGITGISQTLGRSDLAWDEIVRLDIYYAEHWTPGMDLRILLQTIPAVLQGRGAY